MKRNVGSMEQYGRIGVGVLSSVGAVLIPGGPVARVALGVMGLFGLGTGISRYCPISDALGVNRFREERPVLKDTRNKYKELKYSKLKVA